jgi:hypothetical protein
MKEKLQWYNAQWLPKTTSTMTMIRNNVQYIYIYIYAYIYIITKTNWKICHQTSYYYSFWFSAFEAFHAGISCWLLRNLLFRLIFRHSIWIWLSLFIHNFGFSFSDVSSSPPIGFGFPFPFLFTRVLRLAEVDVLRLISDINC